jgi:hypothetical protein
MNIDIKQYSKGPYDDYRDDIIKWYNNFANNIEQKHLMILGETTFVKDSIIESPERFVPRDCIIWPLTFTEKNEFIIKFENDQDSHIKKLIYIDDIKLNYSMLDSFYEKISGSIFFKQMPAIVNSKKAMKITRSFEKMHNLFEIIFADRETITNEEYNDMGSKISIEKLVSNTRVCRII